jgi:hypothetical protein
MASTGHSIGLTDRCRPMWPHVPCSLRRSYQEKSAKAPIHMISAFAARQRRVLGIKVAEKSNEIVAILKPNFDSAKVWSTGKPNKC